jgi:hypothetical protein
MRLPVLYHTRARLSICRARRRGCLKIACERGVGRAAEAAPRPVRDEARLRGLGNGIVAAGGRKTLRACREGLNALESAAADFAAARPFRRECIRRSPAPAALQSLNHPVGHASRVADRLPYTQWMPWLISWVTSPTGHEKLTVKSVLNVVPLRWTAVLWVGEILP